MADGTHRLSVNTEGKLKPPSLIFPALYSLTSPSWQQTTIAVVAPISLPKGKRIAACDANRFNCVRSSFLMAKDSCLALVATGIVVGDAVVGTYEAIRYKVP
ncbi:hypothetical protein K1719_043975 [Acacia pycnantha]|nr:hypothetical protein K1719_043975 [Acacia pycnantha]